MKDTISETAGTVEFRPGKTRIQTALNSKVASFLADTGQMIQDAYEACDDAETLLDWLVENAQFGAYQTEWAPPRGAAQKFDNRYRSIQISQTEELRCIVSLNSRGEQTVTFHVWWKPS
jgi:hypothetical protein